MMRKPLKRTITLLYASTFLSSCVFFYPVLALYLQGELSSVFRVTLLYAIITFASAALEIPTGILSDFLGRRTVFILGRVADCIAIAFLAFGTEFVHFVLYAVSVAFLSALSSGNDDALLYDSLRESDEEHLYKKVSGRMSVIGAVAVGGASVIGSLCAGTSYRLPVLLSLVPATVNVAISFLIREPARSVPAERSVRGHMREVASYFLRQPPFLILAAAIVLLSFTVEPVYQLLQIFYRENGIPVAWFGFLYAVGMAFRSLGAASSHAACEKIGEKHVLLLVTACMFILSLLATYLGGWMAAFAMCVGSAAIGILFPVLDHRMHRDVDTRHRATIPSVLNLATCLGLGVLVPLAGFLSDHAGIRLTYRIFAMSYVVFFLLLAFLKEEKRP